MVERAWQAIHPSERMVINFGSNRETCTRWRKGSRTGNINVIPHDRPAILERISSFNRLRQVMAWILQFVHNCCASKTHQAMSEGTLKTDELVSAEERWIFSAQQRAYPEELNIL